MKLVIGLGNPGPDYTNTRHNFGFLVLDQLSSSWTEKKQFNCQISKIKDVLLCRPLTFMNNSGQAVQAIASYYKINSEDIIVVHDDLDLPLGQIKTGIFSGSAGHNGIKSIQQVIGKDFVRVRLGIGRPSKDNQGVADYVLEKFSATELKTVKSQLETAAEIVRELIIQPLTKVQNKYN